MSSPAPLSDADTLLSVCRVVWPDYAVQNYDGEEIHVSDGQGCLDEWLKPTSLDDLRRVLLALSGEQRAAFDGWLRAAAEGEAEAGMPYAYALTAPTSTILDALHRAVVSQ